MESTTTEITTAFLGKLGEAVQRALSQESGLSTDIYQDLTWLANPKTEAPQDEEVLLVITKVDDLSSEDLALLQSRQGNFFTIVITIAPVSQIRECHASQQELLAVVDAMFVLPDTEEDSVVYNSDTVNAICQTLKYLTALIQAAWDSEVNVDFEDVKTVIRSKRPSSVSIAKASGKDRVAKITKQLFSWPYMVPGQAQQASRLLLQILSNSKAELEMDELTKITDAIQEACGEESEMIFGHSLEESLDHEIEVILLVAY